MAESDSLSDEEAGLTRLIDVVASEEVKKYMVDVNKKTVNDEGLTVRKMVQHQKDRQPSTTEEYEMVTDESIIRQLRRENCALLTEREEMLARAGAVHSEVNQADDLEGIVNLKKGELMRTKQSRDQLKEMYANGNQEVNKQEFEELKQTYFKLIVEAGEMEQRLSELHGELNQAKVGVGNLQRKLHSFGVQPEGASPWSVGVPYRNNNSKGDRRGGGPRW